MYVGIVTYGNLKYTKLAVCSALETCKAKVVLVVGKPDDQETALWAKAQGKRVHVIEHRDNKGFPASINDIYDYVYAKDPNAPILFMGNDTIAYPGAIDKLFRSANETDYDYISGQEVNVNHFLFRYPQYKLDVIARHFGIDEKFTAHLAFQPEDATIREISFVNGFHNFGLVKRSYFDKVGYVDPNFYPAYYEDNDYVRRGFLAECRFAELPGACYFHFWSRTIHEAHPSGHNARYFPLNRRYYTQKWGGVPSHELYVRPFSGMDYTLIPNAVTIGNDYFDGRTRNESIENVCVGQQKWTPIQFRNRHNGQRCIIACNGPSLNDIEFTGDEIVFALNRGYLKYDMLITYLVCCSGTVLAQYGREISDTATEATFISRDDALWRPHVFGLLYTPEVCFRGDASGALYQGHSVAYIAAQLAYYMGFVDVAIVGMDHYYPRAEGGGTNCLVVSESEDIDHFDPEYFGPGARWEPPNLPRVEEAFALARQAFEVDGRRLVNCSTRTRMPESVLPRMSLGEWKR